MRSILLGLMLILPLGNVSLAQDTLKLLFAGDVMQHAGQLKSALLPGKDSLHPESYDYRSYFKHLHRHLLDADLALLNLETTLEALPYSGYPCFSAPISLVDEAYRSGFNIFLLANNHIADKGRRGMKTTLKALENSGYRHTGLYADSCDYAENAPLIVEEKGIRIAFINFTYGLNGRSCAPSPYIVPLADQQNIRDLIQKARIAGAELMIALPHWGTEYQRDASLSQKQWKEFLQKEGVRIIIGSHPHVIQEIEETQVNHHIRELTVYSLGNLISNMSKKDTRVGRLLEIRLCKKPDGQIEICSYEDIWTWCSLSGRLEDGHTVIPIKDFLEKKTAFRDSTEYERMIQSYKDLKRHYDIH